jgi:hypothetical protein
VEDQENGLGEVQMLLLVISFYGVGPKGNLTVKNKTKKLT